MFGARPVATSTAVALQHLELAASFDGHLYPEVTGFDGDDTSLDEDAMTSARQLGEPSRDLFVFAREEPRSALDDGHVAAEGIEHVANSAAMSPPPITTRDAGISSMRMMVSDV